MLPPGLEYLGFNKLPVATGGWPNRLHGPKATQAYTRMTRGQTYTPRLGNGDVLELKLGGTQGATIQIYRKMDKFYLQIGDEDTRIQLFTQQKNVITVGHDIEIANPSVERYHLELSLTPNNALLITDCSMNDTSFRVEQAPDFFTTLTKTRLVNPNLGGLLDHTENPNQTKFFIAILKLLRNTVAGQTLTFFINASGATSADMQTGFFRVELDLNEFKIDNSRYSVAYASIPYIQAARLDRALFNDGLDLVRTLWDCFVQVNNGYCLGATTQANSDLGQRGEHQKDRELVGLITSSCGLRNTHEKWMAMTDGPDVVGMC